MSDHRKDIGPTVVVGLGARASATAAELLALIDLTLAATGHPRSSIALCTTAESKLHHPALVETATTLGVPLLAAKLDAAVPNPSDTVRKFMGIPSVAEAAALSFGPLLVEKQVSPNATCALAQLQPATSAMTPSTLSTSGAGG